jgi:hypothetical protein
MDHVSIGSHDVTVWVDCPGLPDQAQRCASSALDNFNSELVVRGQGASQLNRPEEQSGKEYGYVHEKESNWHGSLRSACGSF